MTGLRVSRYDWLDSNLGLNLDLIVYLRTSPEVAFERLRQRGRKEEEGVPMAFIEGLHQSYEDWLIRCVCSVVCYAPYRKYLLKMMF